MFNLMRSLHSLVPSPVGGLDEIRDMGGLLSPHELPGIDRHMSLDDLYPPR
jgi:hypothetical protein